jgi:hypothetical protein
MKKLKKQNNCWHDFGIPIIPKVPNMELLGSFGGGEFNLLQHVTVKEIG